MTIPRLFKTLHAFYQILKRTAQGTKRYVNLSRIFLAVNFCICLNLVPGQVDQYHNRLQYKQVHLLFEGYPILTFLKFENF